MLLGRWRRLLDLPAADTCLTPPSFSLAKAGRVAEGGQVLANCLDEVKPNTLAARALSVAAAAQEWLEQNQRRRTALRVAFVIAALRALGTAAASGRAAVRGASAEEKEGEGFEYFEAGDLNVLLTINAKDQVVATLHRSGQPLSGVGVTLGQLRASGEQIECARGVTDSEGDAVLGPLKDFPRPAVGESYQLVLVLPPEQGVQAN
jgi:hypothetical protein